jgi:hypothetical protein
MIHAMPKLSSETVDRLIQSYVLGSRPAWSVLKASGPGIRDYLQGQITQDMAKLTPGQGIHACLLTPQGKPVSELYIIEGHDDALILLTPKSYAVQTVARLRQFAIAHDLRIGVVDSLGVCSIQGANSVQALSLFGLPDPGQDLLASSRSKAPDTHALVMPADPRGFWIVAPFQQILAVLDRSYASAPEAEFEAMRIIRGIPDFGKEWDESIHPLNANLIEFHGVSFEKGCYVGQEVTSRMHWRGGIKKKLYRVAVDGQPDSLPCPLMATAKIGELKSAAIDHEGDCLGIALLPIEMAESKVHLELENGAHVTILEVCHA